MFLSSQQPQESSSHRAWDQLPWLLPQFCLFMAVWPRRKQWIWVHIIFLIWKMKIIIIHASLYPGGSAGKESTCNAGDLGLMPGLGRSPGKGNGSVQFSCSVMSDSLQSHEPQHARPPCPSPTPRVHTNPCPLSQWCHQTISASAIPFSSCPQSSPASGVFSNESALRIKWPKYWSISISPSNEHPGLIFFRMYWLDLLAVQGTSKSLLQYHSSKASIFWHPAFVVTHSNILAWRIPWSIPWGCKVFGRTQQLSL